MAIVRHTHARRGVPALGSLTQAGLACLAWATAVAASDAAVAAAAAAAGVAGPSAVTYGRAAAASLRSKAQRGQEMLWRDQQ